MVIYHMEQELIKALDKNLECSDCKVKTDKIIMEIHSIKETVTCPFCGCTSSRVHSRYQREIQDISLLDKQMILLLDVRKMFCDNNECDHKTFSERFDFIASNSQKTNRLINKILITSTKLSSVSATTLFKSSGIKTSKSSICDLLKKNASHCG